MDRGGKPCLADLRAELSIDEAKDFTERWVGRMPGRLGPVDPEAGKAVLLALISAPQSRTCPEDPRRGNTGPAGGRDPSRPVPSDIIQAVRELARGPATAIGPPPVPGADGEGAWSAWTRAALAAMEADPESASISQNRGNSGTIEPDRREGS
jgi:hypothetical protein